jgi:hypothetical protein
MQIVRILITATVLTLAGSPSVLSQSSTPSPESLQAARELVFIVSDNTTSDFVSKMSAQVWPSIETGLRAQNSKIDKATITELRSELDRVVGNYFAEIMKDAPALYARYYTVQEMHEIIAFYRTPTGAKTLKVMPQAMADISASMAPRMQGLQEKVSLAFLNVLQKRGYYAQ